MLGDARPQPLPARLDGVRRREPSDLGEHPTDERERRAVEQRVAAREPHREILVRFERARDDLAREPRLADARLRGHDDDARAAVLHALIERAEHGAHLDLATDARRRRAEQRPCGEALASLGRHHVAGDLEARLEQLRGRIVDAHAFGGRSAERAHRAVDRFADD